MRFGIALLAFASAGFAQSPTQNSTPSPTANAGVATEWDTRALVTALDHQLQRLRPLLDQIKPEEWTAHGAPAAYVQQWRNTEAELRYVLQSSAAFMKEPARLPLALDTYFRLESTGTLLSSLIEGARKYQNPATADLIQSIVNESAGNRDKLRQYIQDLATEKEQEFKIADREAQRCRARMLSQPSTNTRDRRKSH